MIAQAGLRTPLHRPDWTTSRLKFIFDRKKRSVCDDDGVVTAFRDGVVTLRSNRREDGFTFADKEIGYQGVEPGDLVIHAMDGFAGAIGVSDSRGKCSPVYTITVPHSNAEAHTPFWAYYLRNLAITGFIESLAKGIRERSTDFRWNDAGNLLVNFPDINTQKAIADFLDSETDRIDQLIVKKRQLVDLIRERKRSLINLAVTIGFRDCETRETNEKWLGKVAAHWRVAPLKWFTRLQSGFAFKADRFGDIGTRLVRMNNIKRGVLDLDEAVCIAEEDINMSAMLHAGDILIGMSGSIGETGSLGNFAVVQEDDLPCLLNQRVGRFQFVGNKLLPGYLQLVIQSAPFLDPIFLAATSTAQFNVSPYQVGAIMFALPPVSEQTEIINNVARQNIGLDRVLDRTVESITRLREFRSALITAAVTGQIDVTTWGRQGQTNRRLDEIQEAMGA